MPFLTEAQRRPISASIVHINHQSRPQTRTPHRQTSPQQISARSAVEERIISIDEDKHQSSTLPTSLSVSVVDPNASWERQITRWLASRGLAEDLGSGDTVAAAASLPARLQDGVLLGRLLEGLEPTLRLTGFNRKARSRAAALANLELVLAAIWRRAPLARDMPTAEEVRGCDGTDTTMLF